MPRIRRSYDTDSNNTFANATYKSWVGFIFIFNLIVGTGALTLPAVFARAGWLLSLIVVFLLAFVSIMTATFVIEAMACANAVRNWQRLQLPVQSTPDLYTNNDSDDDTQSLLLSSSNTAATPMRDSRNRVNVVLSDSTETANYYYKLDMKFELGEMAVLFFNDIGRILFYLCIATYLYGDLSIYSAAIAKSLRDITCMPKNNTNGSNVILYNFADADDDDVLTPCWQQHTLTRLQMYRLFVIGFTLFFGPFAAFSVQKTKYLQIVTVIFRWLAFIFMISIAIKILLTDGAQGHPPPINIYGLPSLFGSCVYSFMCHHSLPSLLVPIRDKSKIKLILTFDYVLIAGFYTLLAMTGAFAFAHLQDLYTLNFIPTHTDKHNFETDLLLGIDYFLALFPVFTLSTSYPIIAITLRNNLQSLFLDMTRFDTYNYFIRYILFPMLAVVPPFIITYFTDSITSLVAFTGSYAGAAIQYIIPVSLVYYARQTCTELLGNGIINEFKTQFRSKYWLLFILFWTLVCMCLVTLNFFLDKK